MGLTTIPVDVFLDRIQHVSYYSDCTNNGHWINDVLIPNKCIRFSYREAVKLIKRYEEDIYYQLVLNMYNPWSNKTYRSRDGKYFVITHSAIEYVFQTNL